MGIHGVINDSSDPVIEYRLDENLLDGRREYYITTLDPRFEVVDEIRRRDAWKTYDDESFTQEEFLEDSA
ncbi:MAG: hypothetical protein ABSB56_06390 [Nitrososphaerales archaeon]|jgi:hypothetical protein